MSDPAASAKRTVNMANHSFARLLFSLLRKRFTGSAVLEQVEPEAGTRTIWFRGGMPVYTDWVSSPDALGELLLERRVISQSTLDEALSEVEKSGKRMGQVLLARAEVDAAKLSSALRLQCANKLVHVFALTQGEVVLEASEALDLPDDVQGQVNVLQLVFKGVQAHYDETRIRQEMGQLYDQKAVASKALTRYQSQFGFGRNDAATLRSLMGGLELPKLRESYGEQGMQVAFSLWACQMLRVGDAASAAEAKAKPRRAPSGPQPVAKAPRAKAPSPNAGGLPPPPGVGAPADSRPPPPPSRSHAEGPPPPAITGASIPLDSDPPMSSLPAGLQSSGPMPSSRPKSQPSSNPAASSRPGRPSRPATRSRPPVPADPAERAALEERIRELETKIDQEANPFVIFGIEPGASKKEIRSVWGQLSKAFHPDALESKGLTELRERAERVFAAISEAYGVLSNKAQREQLEAVLEMGGTGKVGEDASQLVKNALEAEMLIREAERHVRGGQYKRALDEYTRANKLNPDMPEIQAGLAYSTFAAGAHVKPAADQALETLEAIVKENERLALAHFFIGMVCVMSEGSTTRATTAFAEAHDLDPRLVEAQRQLNALRIKQRQARDEKKKKKKGFGGFFGR